MVSISYGLRRQFSEFGFKYGIDQVMEIAKNLSQKFGYL